MPHGENVILVLDEHDTVERVIFKDIAEEIAVMDPDGELPPQVERIRVEVPDDEKLLSIFTDVFDCFFRFLAAILAEDGVLDEDDFWRTVADVRRATTSDRCRTWPTGSASTTCSPPEFALSCLNRLQLRNNQQMVDLADPSAALQFVGTLANPLAAHAPPATLSRWSAGRDGCKGRMGVLSRELFRGSVGRLCRAGPLERAGQLGEVEALEVLEEPPAHGGQVLGQASSRRASPASVRTAFQPRASSSHLFPLGPGPASPAG